MRNSKRIFYGLRKTEKFIKVLFINEFLLVFCATLRSIQ